MGFKQIGQGSFATVHGHPDLDFVVKVGGISQAFGFYDAWPLYAKMVRTQFPFNPHAPKITVLREFGTEHFYVAVIERLETTVWAAGDTDELYWQTQHVLERWGGQANHEFEEKHPELYDLLLGIKSLGRTFDLHSENVMLRRDGSLVITDPIY